jgi:hypothetical protein
MLPFPREETSNLKKCPLINTFSSTKVAARFKHDAEMLIAYHAIKGSALARLQALHRCNQRF